MELSDENLITLSQYLQQTLNPNNDIRRPGEYTNVEVPVFGDGAQVNKKSLNERVLNNKIMSDVK